MEIDQLEAELKKKGIKKNRQNIAYAIRENGFLREDITVNELQNARIGLVINNAPNAVSAIKQILQ